MTSSEDNKIYTYKEFYIPNKPLTRKLIGAGIACEGEVLRSCGEELLAEEVTSRISEEVSLRLWLHLGTRAHRSTYEGKPLCLDDSDLWEDFGLPEDAKCSRTLDPLVEDFRNWLVGIGGEMAAPWGTVSTDDRTITIEGKIK